ncbi:MAG: hypothetical protein KatS3mg031_0028 [Chitinophagales bacterium]|nr:MAG: hypothetical protein KatS3mg031_0028 [Chitinophagales bacterium]
MKTVNLFFILLLSIFVFNACEKEDGENELHLKFKTDSGYVYRDTSLVGGSSVKIGVEAETEKAKDPIISFNISESVNGGAPATVYQQNLNVTQYEYDYSFVLATTAGEVHTYIFTITNRDGFQKQIALTITIQ